MRTFLSFVRKEFFHIFRDVRTMMILLAMPVVQIILFGFALNTEVKNVRIAILNPKPQECSQRLIDRIHASAYFEVVRHIENEGQIDQGFRSGDFDVAMVFPESFAQDLIAPGGAQIQVIVDASDPNMGGMYSSYVSRIINDYLKDLSPQSSTPPMLTPEVRMLYNPQMESAYNFVPGVMGLILMLICAMMTAVSIVREKEVGTMEVLLVSPIRPIWIIVAKVVPYLVLSMVNLCSIILLSVFVLHVPISGSLFWVIVISFLFVLVSLGFGLMISNLVKSQVAAMLASGMVLMMPVMVLSGMIFPIDSMPKVLQWVTHIIPARWYITAMKKIMIQGAEVSYVLNEIGILLVMMIVLLVVSLLKFKKRLE